MQKSITAWGGFCPGRIFGLHGCGHIGQHVVRLLSPFGCTVLAHDLADRSGILAVRAPFLSRINCSSARKFFRFLMSRSPNKQRTSTALFSWAGCGPIVSWINTARGELVDEQALYEVLSTGRLFAACSDVFRGETSFTSKLVALPNFFGTPAYRGECGRSPPGDGTHRN